MMVIQFLLEKCSKSTTVIFNFFFQERVRWVNKNPVSMSQVNNYMLMNIGHVCNGKVLYGYELMKQFSQKNTSSGNEMLCHILWMKSPHLEFMPWISIPCNDKVPSSLIMCEYPCRIQTNHSSLSNVGPMGTRLVYPQHACEKYWTQIEDMCYRIYHADVINNEGQMLAGMPTCAPIPNLEFYKYIQNMSDLYQFLEEFLRIRRYYLPMFRLRVHGRCKFIQRYNNASGVTWCVNMDCSIYKSIKLTLYNPRNPDKPVSVADDDDDHDFTPYKSSMGMMTEIYGGNINIRKLVAFAAYYAKVSPDAARHSIAIQHVSQQASVAATNAGQCGPARASWSATRWMVHYTQHVAPGNPINTSLCIHVFSDNTGLPEGLNINKHPTPCRNARYVLHQKPPHHYIPSNGSCGQDHITCDGSCITKSRQCDRILNCKDGSDELNCPSICTDSKNEKCLNECVYPHCFCFSMYFQCPQSYCISMSKVCDHIPDCPDQSDEACCPTMTIRPTQYIGRAHPSPKLNISEGINEMSTDNACIFTRRASVDMTDRNHHLKCCHSHQCPGMYKCHNSYCIPYRYVCDGHKDCPSGEEEMRCERLVCEGMLKCMVDNICVSWQEVCDGVKHCINSGDDEIFCDLPACPADCYCHGLLMDCVGTNMTYVPSYYQYTKSVDLSDNFLVLNGNTFSMFPCLSQLNISLNRFDNLKSEMFLIHNILHSIDLTINGISVIEKNSFLGLKSLDILRLQKNVITTLKNCGFAGLSRMTFLDLSGQKIEVLHSHSLYGPQCLTLLNLSQNCITHIGETIFSHLSSIQIIDLTVNIIRHIDINAIAVLPSLKAILSTVERFCCLIPPSVSCTPTIQSQIADSCKMLIPNRVLEFQIWVIGPLVILLAIFIIIIKSHLKKRQGKGANKSHMLMVNLDSTIGIYLLTLASFNLKFQNQFPLQVYMWRERIACRMAGYFFFIHISNYSSSTVMAIFEWFFIVYRPFNARERVSILHILSPIILALLVAGNFFLFIFHVPERDICLHSPITFKSIFLSTVLIIWTISDFILTVLSIILTVIALYISKNVRKSAGRHWSSQETKFALQYSSLNMFNILRWAVFVQDTWVVYSGATVSETTNLWIIASILPFTAIFKSALLT